MCIWNFWFVLEQTWWPLTFEKSCLWSPSCLLLLGQHRQRTPSCFLVCVLYLPFLRQTHVLKFLKLNKRKTLSSQYHHMDIMGILSPTVLTRCNIIKKRFLFRTSHSFFQRWLLFRNIPYCVRGDIMHFLLKRSEKRQYTCLFLWDTVASTNKTCCTAVNTNVIRKCLNQLQA